MTRIDFYTLSEGSRADRFMLTCRLVDKIYREGYRILIHVPDRDQARHIDRLLWTYRDQSFIPHGRTGEVDHGITPVLIDDSGQPEEENQVLVNLGLEVPAFYARFERFCEIADNDPEVRNAGRTRYAYYREQGYPLYHHRID